MAKERENGMKKIRKLYLTVLAITLLFVSIFALSSCGDDSCKQHQWDEGTTVDATCYQQGAIAYTCTKCGKIKTELIPPKGHSFTNYVDNGDATCELDGTKTAACDNGCGATDTQPTPKRHSFGGEWSSDANGHFHLCTGCGKKDAVIEHTPDENGFNCSVCGYAIHTHTPTKVDMKAATCTEKGNVEYWTCPVCNFKFADEACTTIITNVEIPALNHSAIHTSAKAATCTSSGNVEFWYCSTCDKFYSDALCTSVLSDADRIISPLNHTYSVLKKGTAQHWYECSCGDVKEDSRENHISSGAPTAETPETCTVCGYIINPVTTHTHSTTHVAAKAATCTEDGNIEFYFCEGCESFYSDAACQNLLSDTDIILTKTGHNAAHVEAKNPTCTENGNIEHWYCNRCDKYFSDSELTNELDKSIVIRAARHNAVVWTGAVAPTCTKGGNIAYWHCQTCDKYYSNEALTAEISLENTAIECSGHKVTYIAKVDATCTTPGVAAHYLCSNCKKSYTTVDCSVELAPADRVIDAPGHIAESTPHEIVNSTCTTNGYLIFKCENCEYTYRNGTLPLADCSWELVSQTPATCQATGLEHYECEICGDTKNVVLPKTDHNVGAGVPVPNTCTEDGYTLFTCKTEGCGYSYRTNTISKKGHSYVVDEDDSTLPTCTVAGVRVTVCENGCSYRFEETLPATGHTVNPTCENDSKCEDCDYVASKTGHNYKVSELVNPTCTEDGFIKYTCTNAGCEHPTVTETPDGYAKKGHRAPENAVWTEVTKAAEDGVKCHVYVERSTKCRDCDATVITKGDEHFEHKEIANIITEATCNTDGVKKFVCSVCGEKTREGDSTETFQNPDAHTWNAGEDQGNGTILYTCSACGETKTTVSAKTESSATIDSSVVASTTDVELEHATFVPDDNIKGSLSGNVTFGAEEKDLSSLGLPSDVLTEIGNSPVYDFTLKVNGNDVGTLNGDMKVRVPYTLEDGEDVNNIVILYINYGENYENDPTDVSVDHYDAVYVIIDGQGYAEFTTNHFSQYTVTKMSPEQRCSYYGHSFTDTITVPKTCLTDGYEMKICTRCGHIETNTPDELKCTGHDWVEEEATKVIRTCEVDGYLKVSCNRKGCGMSYEIREAATGHSWIKDTENSVESTCTSHGVSKYICTNDCGSTKTETSPLKAHSYTTTTVEATCTEDGYTKQVCEKCNHTSITNQVKALGHSFIDEEHKATCIENGYTSHYCERCDKEFPDTAGESRSDSYHKWTVEAPTCTEDKICEHCGTLAKDGRAIGHSFGANGICVRDNCSHKCEHNYVFLKEVAASCVKPAHEIHQCDVCLSTKEMNFEGEKAAHNMPDGICTVCGLTSGNHYLSMIETWKDVNGFAIKLSDFSLSIEEYIADKTAWYVSVEAATLDVAELMLYIDENGALAGAFNGKIKAEILSFGKETYVYGVSAAIENGYVYLELLDGFDDVSALNETFMVISLDTVTGPLMSSIAELDKNGMISTALDWASDELLPILTEFKNSNASQIDVIIKSLINILITEEITEDGFAYTLDYDKLHVLNENLAALPLAELVDLYFGYGSYDKLLSAITTVLDTKIPEIPALLTKIGLDSNKLIAAVNSLAEKFGEEDFDVSLLINDPRYANLTVGTLAFGMEPDDYTELVSGIAEGFRYMSLYAMFAPAETPEEMELGITSIRNIVDTVIGEIEDIVNVSFKTNTAGKITSISLNINKLLIASSENHINGTSVSGERTTISFELEFAPNGRINLNTDAIITKINEYVNLPEFEADVEYEYDSSFGDFEGNLPEVIDFAGKTYEKFEAMSLYANRYHVDLTNPVVTTISEICGDRYLSGVAFARICETLELDMYMVYAEDTNLLIYEVRETGVMFTIAPINENTMLITFADGTTKTAAIQNDASTGLEFMFTILGDEYCKTTYNYQMTPDLYIVYDNKTGEHELVYGYTTIHSLVLNEEKTVIKDECESSSVYFYECENCSYTTKRYEHNEHTTTDHLVLHEGATSCNDGIDIHKICTKCKKTVSVFENAWHGHMTSLKYSWDEATSTLTASGSCLCGEEKVLPVIYKITGDGNVDFADGTDGPMPGAIKLIPKEDGIYELCSKDVYFYVVDENGNTVFEGGSGNDFNDSCEKHVDKNLDGFCDMCGTRLAGGGFGSSIDKEDSFISVSASREALTLKGGETYYIILKGTMSSRGARTVDVSLRESVEISLDDYGCTCGKSMTVTDNFERKTATLPEHTDTCPLTHYDEIVTKVEKCKIYELLIVTFVKNGEVTDTYEVYKIVVGYDEHDATYKEMRTLVDAVDEYGNLVVVETIRDQNVCTICGEVFNETVHITASDKKTGFMRYTKREIYSFNQESGKLELDHANGEIRDRITFADGVSEIKTVCQYTYYYKSGVAAGGSKTEYIYDPENRCVLKEKITYHNGETDEKVYFNHDTAEKLLTSESGTETVYENGIKLTLTTEAKETYCKECFASISKTVTRTYVSEDSTYKRVENEYYDRYANSATDYGYRISEKSVSEVGYVISGDEKHEYRISYAIFNYDEKGEISYFEKQLYNYSGNNFCEYTVTYFDSENPDGWNKGEVCCEHIAEKYKYFLHDGSTTCEEGFDCYRTCAGCGLNEFWNSTSWGDHNTYYTSTTYDLKDYGSVCGGTVTVESCLCGKNKWVNLNEECDLDDMGDGRYCCSVQDPNCDFEYVHVKNDTIDEECNVISDEYYIFGTGENALKIVLREGPVGYKSHNMVIPGGNRYDQEGDYTVIISGGVATCSVCGHKGMGVEIYTYMIGNDTYKTVNVEYDEEGNVTYRYIREYLKFTRPNDQTQHMMVDSLERTEYYDNGELTYWYQTAYNYDDGCPLCPSSTYTNSDGSSTTNPASEHDSSNLEFVETVQFTSCTQSGIEKRICPWCNYETNVPTGAYYHHMEWNEDKGVYVCTRCNLESDKEALGDVILEELTKSYGNGEYIVVGYKNTGEFFDFLVNISIDGTEAMLLVYMPGNENLTDSRIYIDVDALLSALATYNEEHGTSYSLCENSVRVSIVPIGGDTTFDYHIALDPHVIKTEVTFEDGNIEAPIHTYTCVVCNEKVDSVALGTNNDWRSYRDENGVERSVATHFCFDCGHKYYVDSYSITDGCEYSEFRELYLYENGEYVFKYKENGYYYVNHQPSGWTETVEGNVFTRAENCLVCGEAVNSTSVNAVLPDDVTFVFTEAESSSPRFELTVSESGKYKLYTTDKVGTDNSLMITVYEDGITIESQYGNKDGGNVEASCYFESGKTYCVQIGTWEYDGNDAFSFVVEKTQ